jgi:hypothetical protein
MQTLQATEPAIIEIKSKSGWSIYLLAVLLVVIAKLPTFNNNILFIDEPGYLGQAQRLNSIEAFLYSFLYRTDPKFQIGLLPDLLALAISPENSILLMRLFGLLALLVSACLILKLSSRFFSSHNPGFFAVVMWMLFLNHDTLTAPPLMEYFQTPLVLLCLWLLITGLERRLPLFLSGFCLALATLVKAPAIVLAVVVIVYLVGSDYQRYQRISLKSILTQLGYFCLGLGLPVLLVVLPYFIRPETMPYLTFNIFETSQLYAAFDKKSIVDHALAMFGLLGFFNNFLIVTTLVSYLAVKLLHAPRSWNQLDSYQLLILAFSAGLFAGYTTGQSKVHYLVPTVPFIMLFVGYRLKLIWDRLSNRRWRVGLAMCLTLLVCFFEFQSIITYLGIFSFSDQIYRNEVSDLDQTALVNYIQANTRAEDTIWVYYNAPEIYIWANRRSAINDIYGAWLIHLYNSFWIEKTYRELEQANPALVIGLNQPRYPEKVDRVTEIPLVKDWLAQNYNCDNRLVSGAVICQRKH